MTRVLHRVNAILLGLLFGGSLWAFPGLPDQIPRHFGFWGHADAYWDSTLLHWMAVPLITFGVVAVVYGSAWFIGRDPSSINVPKQDVYDALDVEQQRRVVAHVQLVLSGMATSIIVFLGAIQAGIYEVATSAVEVFPPYVTAALVFFVLVVGGGSAGLLWWLHRRIPQLSDDP